MCDQAHGVAGNQQALPRHAGALDLSAKAIHDTAMVGAQTRTVEEGG
jgi:hypothetical protein